MASLAHGLRSYAGAAEDIKQLISDLNASKTRPGGLKIMGKPLEFDGSNLSSSFTDSTLR
jgi:hypothetical protein